MSNGRANNDYERHIREYAGYCSDTLSPSGPGMNGVANDDMRARAVTAMSVPFSRHKHATTYLLSIAFVMASLPHDFLSWDDRHNSQTNIRAMFRLSVASANLVGDFLSLAVRLCEFTNIRQPLAQSVHDHAKIGALAVERDVFQGRPRKLFGIRKIRDFARHALNRVPAAVGTDREKLEDEYHKKSERGCLAMRRSAVPAHVYTDSFINRPDS